MKTSKFLEEIRVIEKKLREKTKDKSKKLFLPDLARQLYNSGQLDKQLFHDLKELWKVRNQIYSSRIPIDDVSDDSRNLLAKTISNPNLQ